MAWAVREIYTNTLAIGYFNSTHLQIFRGKTPLRTIDVSMPIFGFILPPMYTFPTGCELRPEDSVAKPNKLIVLGNERFCVVDLKISDPEDS